MDRHTVPEGKGLLLFLRIPPDGAFVRYTADLYNPARKAGRFLHNRPCSRSGSVVGDGPRRSIGKQEPIRWPCTVSPLEGQAKSLAAHPSNYKFRDEF